MKPALALAAVIGLLALAGRPRTAAAEPSDTEVALVGLGLALPTYVLGVALHEGTHALAARLVGAEVVSVSILPGRDPATGAFHFGLTRARGLRGRGEKVFFYLSPKLSDALIFGGYLGLVTTDAWPEHRYGQVALTVLATGLWVDFAKDVISFSPHNDVVKAMTLCGLDTELRRLPARLGYAALVVASGYFVVRGYQKTFEDPAPTAARIIPLWRAAF